MDQEDGAGHHAITKAAVEELFRSGRKDESGCIGGLTEAEMFRKLDAGQVHQDKIMDWDHLKFGETTHDAYKDPAAQGWHSLGDPRMSARDNIAHIRDNIEHAFTAAFHGDTWGNLGKAIHDLQDSYSDGHMWRALGAGGDPRAPIHSINLFLPAPLSPESDHQMTLGGLGLAGTHDHNLDKVAVDASGNLVKDSDIAAAHASALALGAFFDRQVSGPPSSGTDPALHGLLHELLREDPHGAAMNYTATPHWAAERDVRLAHYEDAEVRAHFLDAGHATVTRDPVAHTTTVTDPHGVQYIQHRGGDVDRISADHKEIVHVSHGKMEYVIHHGPDATTVRHADGTGEVSLHNHVNVNMDNAVKGAVFDAQDRQIGEVNIDEHSGRTVIVDNAGGVHNYVDFDRACRDLGHLRTDTDLTHGWSGANPDHTTPPPEAHPAGDPHQGPTGAATPQTAPHDWVVTLRVDNSSPGHLTDGYPVGMRPNEHINGVVIGHAWLTVQDPDGKRIDVGYYPTLGHLPSPLVAKGQIVTNDVSHLPSQDRAYLWHLTPEQAHEMMRYIAAVEKNPGQYNGVNHNCVTVAVNALSHADIHVNADLFGIHDPATLQRHLDHTPAGQEAAHRAHVAEGDQPHAPATPNDLPTAPYADQHTANEQPEHQQIRVVVETVKGHEVVASAAAPAYVGGSGGWGSTPDAAHAGGASLAETRMHLSLDSGRHDLAGSNGGLDVHVMAIDRPGGHGSGSGGAAKADDPHPWLTRQQIVTPAIDAVINAATPAERQAATANLVHVFEQLRPHDVPVTPVVHIEQHTVMATGFGNHIAPAALPLDSGGHGNTYVDHAAPNAHQGPVGHGSGSASPAANADEGQNNVYVAAHNTGNNDAPAAHVNQVAVTNPANITTSTNATNAAHVTDQNHANDASHQHTNTATNNTHQEDRTHDDY